MEYNPNSKCDLEKQGITYQLKGLNYIEEDPMLVKALIESNLCKLKAFRDFNTQIRVKKVHEREKNCKYQVNLFVNGAGRQASSESIGNNVFAALAEGFDNLRLRLSR